jgi:hypothetical protein
VVGRSIIAKAEAARETWQRHPEGLLKKDRQDLGGFGSSYWPDFGAASRLPDHISGTVPARQ